MWRKLKNIYHLISAYLANLMFLFPSRKLTIVGVTGTDGKTTTVNLIYHILKESGKKVGMISSLGSVISNKTDPIGFHVTTPGAYLTQKILRKAVKAKCEYFILETTSHAIDQNRIAGIHFRIAVLTNVTSEHLDYHKTYDNYLKTKEKLLINSDINIVNKDDKAYEMLINAKSSKDSKNWISYGLSESAEINPTVFKIPNTKMIGDFNKYNILAAVATCRKLGVDDKDILKALETFELPKGRLDFIYKGEFNVMIDFAHTPNAFEQLLKSLRPLVKGKIIHVFGSAGERDVNKRPYMGEISASFADIIVLTAEDPRGEDVSKITEEIAGGIENTKAEVIKIPDRKQAITAAIQMAKKGDLVLLTGKAAEASMNMGNGEEPWDEYRVANEILVSLNLKHEAK